MGGRNEYKSSNGYTGDLSYLDGSQVSTNPRFATPNNKSGLSRLSRITGGGNQNNFSVTVSQEVHTTRDSSRMAKEVHIPMMDLDDTTEVDINADDHVSFLFGSSW